MGLLTAEGFGLWLRTFFLVSYVDNCFAFFDFQ